MHPKNDGALKTKKLKQMFKQFVHVDCSAICVLLFCGDANFQLPILNP